MPQKKSVGLKTDPETQALRIGIDEEILPPPPPSSRSWTLQTTPWDSNGAGDGQSIWSETLGLFIIASDAGEPFSNLITSPDGVIWTPHMIGTNVGGWYGHLPLNDAAPLLITDFGDVSGANAFKSSNGVTWTQLTTPSNRAIDGAAWSPTLGLWAAVSFGGDILTSPDTITWTLRTIPPEFVGSLSSICWSPDLGLFAAIGESNGPPFYGVLISSDGITWTPISAGFTGEGFVYEYDITWSNSFNKFIFACSGNATGDGTSPSIVHSDDGSSWSAGPVGTPHDGESLCVLEAFGSIFAGGYQAAFAGGSVMNTTDLTTWTDISCPLDGQVSSLAYSPSLGMLVAVGIDSSGLGAIATYS